ncbi:hypothetical protein LguiB_032530 [Lonicera macranthoides]
MKLKTSSKPQKKKEAEAEADNFSISIPKLGLKEFEGFEDDKEPIKEDNSYLILEDQIYNDTLGHANNRKEGSREILLQHLEFFIDCSGHQLVPIELLNSPISEKKNESRCRVEEDEENASRQESKLGSKSNDQAPPEPIVVNKWSVWEDEELISFHENTEEPKFAMFESMERGNSLWIKNMPKAREKDLNVQEKMSLNHVDRLHPWSVIGDSKVGQPKSFLLLGLDGSM